MSLARRQLSLFGVEAADPSPLDLAGLLFGPARLTRMGGTARIVVAVDAAWRVHVLAAELALRGLELSWRQAGGRAEERPAEEPPAQEPPAQEPPAQEPPAGEEAPAGAPVARDAPADAARQPAGGGFEVLTAYSTKLAPIAALRRPAYLSGSRLRLWVAAAGMVEPGAAVLRLDPAADPAPVAAALVRVGLAPAAVREQAAFRITGRRRLARLAELVGDRPVAAPVEAWPTPEE